jgi:hypothetical protein
VADTDTHGITITDNYLANCNVGINLGTSNATHGPQNSSNMKMTMNTIVGARSSGIKIGPAAGSQIHDLLISGNTIRDMTGDSVVGIRLNAVGGTDLGGEANISSHTISGNHIANIRGLNAHGIRLMFYPNVRVLNNTVNGADNAAIYAYDANGLEVIANRIEHGGVAAVQLYSSNPAAGFARFVIAGNSIGWDGQSPGILVGGGKKGVIRDNVLKRYDTARPSPVTVTNGSCNVTLTNNVAWFYPKWSETAVPECTDGESRFSGSNSTLSP